MLLFWSPREPGQLIVKSSLVPSENVTFSEKFTGPQPKRHSFWNLNGKTQLLLYVLANMVTFSGKFTGPQRTRHFFVIVCDLNGNTQLLPHVPANMVTVSEKFTGPQRKRHFCFTCWDLIVSLHGQSTM